MARDLQEFIFIPLSDFILGAVGERPYLMNKHFTAPSGDYIAVRIAEISPISWSESYRQNSGDDGLDTVYTTYETQVRIVGFGESSMTKVQSICQGFREKQLLKNLSSKGIHYFDHLPVRDTSVRYMDKIEERYETICSLRFTQGGEDRGTDPSYIETAGASATYNNA